VREVIGGKLNILISSYIGDDLKFDYHIVVIECQCCCGVRIIFLIFKTWDYLHYSAN
jgi:hypothetical protein